MWDALPEELVYAILLQCDDAAVRRTCTRARRVYDEILCAREEEQLSAYMDALRIALPQRTLRTRWMLRRCKYDDATPALATVCARCGARTCGILTCTCHHRTRPPFPWTRVLAGPTLSCVLLALLRVTLPCVARTRG